MDVGAAIGRATAMADAGARRILGIAGCPGAGKSTLAAMITAALGPRRAVLVPMDGFHLANSTLIALGRRNRKGAPDTFDAAGYVALLARLRDQRAGEVVYAPEFRRDFGEGISGAIAVPGDVPLVVTEGNYLLHDAPVWAEVAPLLHECWYVDVGDEVRLERLLARHVHYGKTEQEAFEWVMRSDEANAALIRTTRRRADRHITVA